MVRDRGQAPPLRSGMSMVENPDRRRPRFKRGSSSVTSLRADGPFEENCTSRSGTPKAFFSPAQGCAATLGIRHAADLGAPALNRPALTVQPVRFELSPRLGQQAPSGLIYARGSGMVARIETQP